MFMLRKVREEPQIFDLLQLSKEEKEAKARCLCQIRQFNVWKKIQGMEQDFCLKLSSQIEGILLRRQAQDSVHLYRTLRKERIKSFQNYMDQLPIQKILFHKAS